MSTIGPLVDAGRLELATIATLQDKLPLYLRRIEAASGFDPQSLALVRSFAVVSEYDRFPEEGLPAVIVATPGVIGEPDKEGDGFYRATWSLEVSVTATGRNAREARRHSQMYAAAVRGAMLQCPLSDEEGLRASVVAWLDEAYSDVPTKLRRSILATSNVFAVEVEDVVTVRGEPSQEDETYPVVTETPEVEVEPQ